jgi:hypothetical protein
MSENRKSLVAGWDTWGCPSCKGSRTADRAMQPGPCENALRYIR